MKKIFLMGPVCLVMSLILVLTGKNSFAQGPEPVRPVKTGDEWKMPSDVFQRSRSYADSLTRALGLDAAASKKIYDAYLANTKPVDEITMTPGTAEEKKEKMKANHEAFSETLKGILTPDQFKKYLILYSSASTHKYSWILR